MHITIMGSGGVGGFFGARLAQAGHEVSFVARGAHLAAMRAHGLRVLSPLGDMHLPAPWVTERPADIGQADVILFSVKLWDTETAAESLRPLIGPHTALISLQNGVAKDDILRGIVGAPAVVGGVCYIATTIAEPGVIRHTGNLSRMVFGEHDGRISERMLQFSQACAGAGIDHELSGHIRRVLWEKFVFLAGLSACTTSMRLPIGPIRGHPRTRAFLHDLIDEAVQVARAEGVDLAADFAAQRLAFCDGLPPTMTSSMHHDLDRGGRLELRWLSGDVVARGERLGIATPCHRAVLDILWLHGEGRPA